MTYHGQWTGEMPQHSLERQNLQQRMRDSDWLLLARDYPSLDRNRQMIARNHSVFVPPPPRQLSVQALNSRRPQVGA